MVVEVKWSGGGIKVGNEVIFGSNPDTFHKGVSKLNYIRSI